ncbi:hypothetical protein [Ornithinimicrobium kibberense]|uniref:hypothetical protein n=1 Tax=Ornithinimicrobium kibberense TaxID=282060 RepID=UPI00360A6B4D
MTRKATHQDSRIGRPGQQRRTGGPPARRHRWFRNNRHPLCRFARRRRDLEWPGQRSGTPETVAGRSRQSWARCITQH